MENANPPPTNNPPFLPNALRAKLEEYGNARQCRQMAINRYSNSLHRSLNTEDPSPNHKDNQFANFLSELQCKYDVWPLSKKELATSMITNLLNESNTLFEPTVIQRPRGIPPKAKKKRGVTSTARDPSRFEYVESSQTHNLSNSSKKLA
ncbi:hypothetical protein Tco_0663138 [Tanacetum coccineum]